MRSEHTAGVKSSQQRKKRTERHRRTSRVQERQESQRQNVEDEGKNEPRSNAQPDEEVGVQVPDTAQGRRSQRSRKEGAQEQQETHRTCMAMRRLTPTTTPVKTVVPTAH